MPIGKQKDAIVNKSSESIYTIQLFVLRHVMWSKGTISSFNLLTKPAICGGLH